MTALPEELVCVELMATLPQAKAYAEGMGYNPEEAEAYSYDMIGFWVQQWDPENEDGLQPQGQLAPLTNSCPMAAVMWTRDRAPV